MGDRTDVRSTLAGSMHPFLSVAMSLALLVPFPLAAAEDARPTNAPALTDARIAAIVLAANTIDIENGEMAVARSKNRTVREFAQRMVTDHTSVNARAAALAGRLNLVPEESDASRALVTGADSTRRALGRLKGAAFDRAYVQNEVDYHQAVLDLLDQKIVPSVRNEELKDLLVSVRPAFVAHLDHARTIRASLSK